MHLQRADDSYFARLLMLDNQPGGGFWTLHRMGIMPPDANTPTVLDVQAQGFVGRGAWRVQCPFCGGSQFGNPETQTRFVCCDCANRTVDGAWVSVLWPVNAAELEAVLVARPSPDAMHWQPHEAVEHLWAENVEHRITPPDAVPDRYRRVVDALIAAAHEVEPVHVIAAGTIVHPDSDWHPAGAVAAIEALGANFDEDDVRLALIVHGQGR